MSPGKQNRGRKFAAPNNLYTAMLALGLFAVLATIALVIYKSYIQYDTVFTLTLP